MEQKYTLKQATELLNIGRTTLFNRLEKFGEYLEENKHVTMEKGKKFIDSIGLEIIKNNLIDSPTTTNCDDSLNHQNTKKIELLKKELEYTTLQLNDKNTQIQNFQNEINNKNIQINELIEAVRESRESVKEAHRLNENNQMLLRDSQQRVLMLENHEQKEKSFWKKLFKN